MTLACGVAYIKSIRSVVLVHTAAYKKLVRALTLARTLPGAWFWPAVANIIVNYSAGTGHPVVKREEAVALEEFFRPCEALQQACNPESWVSGSKGSRRSID